MRIDKIHIENFRGIEDLIIELNPHFNLLIGENGSGKTAILEALTVGMGSFFLGIPGIPSRNIKDEDIRYFEAIESSYEYSYKTIVSIEKGIVNGKEISWYKARNGISSKTLHGKDSPIKSEGQFISKSIGDPKRKKIIDLPVLAYYSTSRLWKEGRENEKTEDSKGLKLPSRFRGYKDALQAKSSFSIILEWFKSKFQAHNYHSSNDSNFQLECVKQVILKNIEGAIDLYWEFDKDHINTLHIRFENNIDLPFGYLSDGYRNLLAIFADLAWRCVTLNPQFRENANLMSTGIVLIDEIDLHLHPAWQKTIINQLKETFPKIQFVATTHSPFVIQETSEGELFKMKENKVSSVGGANEYSLEDVAEYIQKVTDPAWSINKKEMYEAAKEYFDLLNKLNPETPPEELNKIREKLNILGKAYSDNVAYTAFLEQKRFLAEEKFK